MGGQHGNTHTTSVYRRVQVRGRPAHAGIEAAGAQVARELGISDNVLYRWRNEQRQ